MFLRYIRMRDMAFCHCRSGPFRATVALCATILLSVPAEVKRPPHHDSRECHRRSHLSESASNCLFRGYLTFHKSPHTSDLPQNYYPPILLIRHYSSVCLYTLPFTSCLGYISHCYARAYIHDEQNCDFLGFHIGVER